MDIKEKASKLNKKIKKLVGVLTDSTTLSLAQHKEKEDMVKDLNKEASWLHAELFLVLTSMWFPGHHMVSMWKPYGINI